MSEENKQEESILKPATESISKTMFKKMRMLTKDQLIDKLVATSNYAENMKAANMVLMYQVKQLNEKLNGVPQDVAASTNPSEGQTNEGN